ncbi:MAG: AAA family ATPase [Ruminococcaceae bacterium]|nr:AAA family ATPase [Oscillospiraceae bacterium]
MDERSLAGVNKKFHERIKNRESLLSARQAEVYRAVPRILEIDNAIFGGGMRMLSAVWDGVGTPESVAESYARETEKLTAEKRMLLREAGFGADYLDVPYTCIHCKDTGMHDGKLCSCYLTLLSEVMTAESGMGKLLLKQTFDTFDIRLYADTPMEGHTLSPRKNMESILNTCRHFAVNFEKHSDSLLLYGNSGLGKTFLSSAIANDLLSRGISVLYQSAGQIVELLSDARFGRNESETRSVLKAQLLKADLLIIDDLGTEFMNSMTEADIFSVVNGRILAEKSTIISTNLSLSDIGRVYSERMLSRILGHYVKLHFYGSDIRNIRSM